MQPAPFDGNAAAGALSEFFAFDVTLALTTCAACGDVRLLAELGAHLRAAGLVLRCASCSAVEIRLVRSADRAWLDLQGVRVLQISPLAQPRRR